MHEDRRQLPPRPIPPLFELGRVVATPGTLELLAGIGRDPLELINRHMRGDWGDLDQEDIDANERSLNCGSRLFSSYNVDGHGTKVWVITEWDRSYTTVLLPSEY